MRARLCLRLAVKVGHEQKATAEEEAKSEEQSGLYEIKAERKRTGRKTTPKKMTFTPSGLDDFQVADDSGFTKPSDPSIYTCLLV